MMPLARPADLDQCGPTGERPEEVQHSTCEDVVDGAIIIYIYSTGRATEADLVTSVAMITKHTPAYTVVVHVTDVTRPEQNKQHEIQARIYIDD